MYISLNNVWFLLLLHLKLGVLDTGFWGLFISLNVMF